MTRKRFIKKCMGAGWSRNLARAIANQRERNQSYDSLWYWDGPNSTARQELAKIVVEVLDKRTGGVFSMVSRMSPYMSGFSYLGGF